MLMAEPRDRTNGYSPEVDIWMECLGRIIPLRQAAPTFVIPFEAGYLPKCDAVVVVSVDGKRFERPVRVSGMKPTWTKASIHARDNVAPF
jgi:hypothetical protein